MIVKAFPMRQAIKFLKEAREAATFERAAFHAGDGPGIGPDITAVVTEETRLYRETWIIGPLDLAIGLLEGRYCVDYAGNVKDVETRKIV